MRKMEFSKKIFIFVSFITISVTAFSLILMWRFGDLSAMAYLIPSVFAEFATATGFYYWKARTENKIKLMKKHGNIAEKAIETEEDKNKFDNYYGGI